ncbi:MAG: SDR family NAD(P)-dependent oxidoreductase [Candidatus Saccharibacteria bacterium]|nr:SDR family NAD(P)-dependent oxidoreductase [Candidatus Saccharibacteria bacterium]
MRTILITGATAGFGLATAKLLANDNKLILLARRQERLDELQKSLGDNVYVAAVDVTNPQQVKDFYNSLPADFKNIDVLVNNAGFALGMEPAQEANFDNWQQMVDTNISGLLRMTRLVVGDMVSRGSGQIINIGSVAGHVPYKGGNVYGATKAFVWQFSRGLRTDLFGTGVKVTNIEPGAAETEFASVRFKDEQKGKDFYAGWKPLKPEDIANTVKWVIDQPPHVNIDNIEIMALAQASAGMVIDKG